MRYRCVSFDIARHLRGVLRQKGIYGARDGARITTAPLLQRWRDGSSDNLNSGGVSWYVRVANSLHIAFSAIPKNWPPIAPIRETRNGSHLGALPVAYWVASSEGYLLLKMLTSPRTKCVLCKLGGGISPMGAVRSILANLIPAIPVSGATDSVVVRDIHISFRPVGGFLRKS